MVESEDCDHARQVIAQPQALHRKFFESERMRVKDAITHEVCLLAKQLISADTLCTNTSYSTEAQKVTEMATQQQPHWW